MAYTKHAWIDNQAPALDEDNLNEMEQGIYDAHESLADKIDKTLFDAYTILYADVDNTPAALTIAASRLVGRKSTGGIAALTAAEVKTLLAIAIADISDIPGTIANILTDHNLAAHTALGLFDESSDVDHNATTNYAANQHVVLPATIAAVLSDHNKAAHDALDIDADTIDGKHLADLLEVAAGDFNAFTEKASPVNADIVLIEDSAASYAKKKVQLVNLPGGGGASTFLGLTDTPAAYTGQAGKYPKVNVGETALEFGVPAGGGDFLADGSVPMTGHLNMGNDLYIQPAVDNNELNLRGGVNYASVIHIIGKDYANLPGQIQFVVTNAAKTGWKSAGHFEGVTDTPKLLLNHGLITDLIEEKTANVGVRVQLKDATFTKNFTFATTDQAAGDAETIASFPKNYLIRKIKFRADKTSGQQTAVTALVNDGDGLAPADTSLAFDGKVGTFVNGNYYMFVGTGEIFMIDDADPETTPIVIVRGQKGTTATYIDDNEQIIALNHGWRLTIFKDSDKKYKDYIAILDFMTAQGTTDAAITLNDRVINLSADLKNVGARDWVVIEDTTDEEALVQYNTGDVANAANDFQLYVRDLLAAHATTKNVEKWCVYDIPVDYRSAGTTLYFTLQCMETTLASNADIHIEIEGEKVY